MKTIWKAITAILIASVMGMTSVVAQSHEAGAQERATFIKKGIFECGNFETALGTLTQGFLQAFAREPSLVDTLNQQTSTAYFLMKLFDCQCQARVQGVPYDEIAGRCFLKAKIATDIYVSTLPTEDESVSLAFDTLTWEEME